MPKFGKVFFGIKVNRPFDVLAVAPEAKVYKFLAEAYRMFFFFKKEAYTMLTSYLPLLSISLLYFILFNFGRVYETG